MDIMSPPAGLGEMCGARPPGMTHCALGPRIAFVPRPYTVIPPRGPFSPAPRGGLTPALGRT
jgi:hypothetical protein